jgi:Tfp pilus assembly protein PilN
MGVFNNINTILGVAVAGLTLFGFFQNKMTNNERRLTILEEKNNQQDRELAEIKNRLDNHDQQMKVLIQMTEQIKNLSEKIEKIDKKLEEVK